MTNHGDDCYFFYYSTCTKGDSCPFRHCEAAMGNETVCNLWQEQRCYRTVCKFRHMEITKNRKEIPCYWENQPAGCQKPHCAFLHEKARFIDGIFVPPDKSLSKKEEQPLEEAVPPPPAPLPTTANPHIRGVIKTETQEPVPSPTHPPVVINPADDDEDEDDQFSEEGEDGKVGPSPRKQITKPDDSLNFGVSTLEEIRLRKALKASMKRAGYPIQSGNASANGEKENIRSFFRPALQKSSEGTGQPKGIVAGRLGPKMSATSAKCGEGIVLKRSLAERLGKFVDEEEPLMPPEKAMKPIKERLGIPSSVVAPSHPAETNVEPKNAPEQIRIKTLEEIRREKAAKSLSQSQNDGPSVVGLESTKTVSTKATKGVKRAIILRDDLIGHVKTFSEILPAKKKRQEDQQEQNFTPQRTRHTVEKAPSKSQARSNTVQPVPEATNVGEVRVKTLEEIRREKAARLGVQQALEPENKKSSETEKNGAEKPCLRRINKLASQTGNVTTEKSAEVTLKPVKTASHEIGPATSKNVKVKTFAEIMQDKHLRRQEMEGLGKTSPEAKPSQKHTVCETVSTTTLARDNLVSTCSSSPSSANSDSTPSTQRPPVPCKLKSKAAKLLKNTKTAANTAVTSVPVKESFSAKGNKLYSQSPSSSMEVLDKNKRNSIAVSPAKQPKIALQGPTAEAPIADTTMAQKKSLDHITDTKVRPKLNVKPSVMKPAVQVKPGQKRKGTQRSAVAAVKPLNSASAELKELLQEIASSDQNVFPSSSSEVQQSFTVSHSPTTMPDSSSSSSPLREQLQPVPVFRLDTGQSQDTKLAINGATSRPVLKTPTHSKTRRLSTASCNTSTSGTTPCTSAGDDFEDLINEFTDDHLEEEVDPGIGEDDLLQELSQMIDS